MRKSDKSLLRNDRRPRTFFDRLFKLVEISADPDGKAALAQQRSRRRRIPADRCKDEDTLAQMVSYRHDRRFGATGASIRLYTPACR